MKRYLGWICIIYSALIGYIWLFDKLKNFLSPNMQIYLKVSLFVFVIMGYILTSIEEDNTKFKPSALILLLPIVAIILAGDGKLSANLASNRMAKYSNKSSVKVDNNKKDDIEIPNIDDIQIEDNMTIEKFDYDIKDIIYDGIASYLTFDETAVKNAGKTIKVRGFVVKNAEFVPKDYFAIGKYSVGCCIADSIFMGFYVDYDLSKIKENGWYEIEGVLIPIKDIDGYNSLAIKATKVTEIDSKEEEQYIYPCYNYDDACKLLEQYGIEN